MTAPTLADEARRLVEYVTSTDRADAEEVVLAALEEVARRVAEDERKRLIDAACDWCRQGHPMCPPEGCDTHRSPGHHVRDDRTGWTWWFPCGAKDIHRVIRAGEKR